jgi:FkbM family methyltransferase
MFLLPIVMAEGPTTLSRESLLFRLRRFLSRPLHEKSRSVYARWRKLFPTFPFPVRLPFGVWFVARNDYLGSTFTADGFERAERVFMQRYIKPGMIVLDIGAHHGLYTLLAAQQVGAKGCVHSFEPSPREQKALKLNLRLNRCKNVTLQPFALGSEETTSDLYVVNDFNTGCNSLRPPDVQESTSKVTVRVRTLDNWLLEQKLKQVDLIKLDVEGGELEALKGAERILQTKPRPVIMCEMQNARTGPWGYRGEALAVYLHNLAFRWFQPTVEGNLSPLPTEGYEFEGNYIAVPEERVPELTSAHT